MHIEQLATENMIHHSTAQATSLFLYAVTISEIE